MGNSNRSQTNVKALICAVGILVFLGILSIYSASALKGIQSYDDPYVFVRKQLIYTGLSIGIFFLVYKSPSKWLERAPLPLLIVTLFFLSLILIPGVYHKAGGAARWLSIGPVRFQTSELAKISLIFFLSKNLSRYDAHAEKFWTGIAPNLAVLGLIGLLVMLQPDFGTASLLAIVTLLMLFLAGIRFHLTLLFLATGCLGFIAAVLYAPYRMKRILAFLDPWTALKSGGFQIIQSYVAFQNGGLLGSGLGESKQKLYFLPEAHTDFILAVIGEELGLIGVILVIASFLLINIAGLRIAASQATPYRRFLALGITLTITVQALLNMGVAMGALPTKGISLPFVSSGVSSLMIFGLMTAILCRLARNNQEDYNGQLR